MRILTIASLAFFGLALLRNTTQAQFIYIPESDNRYVQVHLGVDAYTDPVTGEIRPGYSVVTNASPPYPLADWDAEVALSLPAPIDPSITANSGRAYQVSQFSDYAIQAGLGVYSYRLTGWSIAQSGLTISFQVTAVVAYQLEVVRFQSMAIPVFDLSSTSSGPLIQFPGYPWDGTFSFSGAFVPGDVYTLTTRMTANSPHPLGEHGTQSFTLTLIPEPTTFTLLGLGSLALVMGRRRGPMGNVADRARGGVGL